MKPGGLKSRFSSNFIVVQILGMPGYYGVNFSTLDYDGIGSKLRFGTSWATRVMVCTWFSWTPRVLTLVGAKTMCEAGVWQTITVTTFMA